MAYGSAGIATGMGYGGFSSKLSTLHGRETALSLLGKMQSEENLFIVKSSTAVHSCPGERNGVNRVIVDEALHSTAGLPRTTQVLYPRSSR